MMNVLSFDRKILFNGLRNNFGKLDDVQVTVIASIVDEFERRKLADVRWLAYMLATGWGEATWKPVREIGRGKGKIYGKPVNGKVYYGRGIVQLTWWRNYLKFQNTLNLPLVNDPDMVMIVPVAVAILFEGMTTGITAKDAFTKYQLHDFFNATVEDPVNARRIINGTDKAKKFAAWHRQILQVLHAAKREEGFAIPPVLPKSLPPEIKATTAEKTAGAGAAVVVTTIAVSQSGLPWATIGLIAGCAVAVAVIGFLIFKLRKD